MKPIRLFFAGLALAVAAACSTAPTASDPRQQVVDATAKSAATIDAAIDTAMAAYRSGALKQADAERVAKALRASLESVKAAQASLPPATPASGAK